MEKSQERKAKSKSHSFLVRRPTRRSRGRGVALWPVSPSLFRPRPLARALGTSKKEQERVGRQVRWKLWAMVVLFGMVSPFGLSRNRACRRCWLFGPPAGVAWLLHPAAYPFAPRDFSGSGLAPYFGGLSSPPGFRPGVAQAGVAPPPRPAFKQTGGPEPCNQRNPGYWILASQPVGKPWGVVVTGSKRHPFAPRSFFVL